MNYFNGGQHGERFGDLEWICEQIDKLPIDRQTYTKEKYFNAYAELIELDPENARYRCNYRLLQTVKKYKVVVDNSNLIF